MKIETFKKRFDFPLNMLDGLIMAIVSGRNGHSYYISQDRKGLPIAKKIK